MKCPYRNSPVSLGLLAGLTLLAGCEQHYPQPDGEALLRFVKNARLNGKLRVVWPDGMRYLEQVMQADAQLRRQLLAAAGPVNAAVMLWPKDDPRWRDVDALRPAPEPTTDDDPAAAPAAPFQNAYDELAAAVGALPAGLAPADARSTAFSERVWEALAVDGLPLREYVDRLAAIADRRARLHNRIAKCQDSFDPEAAGLTFGDPECQRKTDALYDELARALAAHREAFYQYARDHMAEVQRRIDQVDKQREREEYLLLDNTREYFKNTLDGWLKEYKNRTREIEQALENHASGQQKLAPPVAAFYERRITELEQERAALKAFALEIGALRSTGHDDD
jgi:hypothetical protein